MGIAGGEALLAPLDHPYRQVARAGLFDRCGTGRRYDWTDITDGWTTPYGGHDPFPVATGGNNFDLDQVRLGQLSMAETINQVVVDSHCNDID